MVDTTKQSNRKCEHCEFWDRGAMKCKKTGEHKYYYHRCKQFQWRADLVTEEAKRQLAEQHLKNEENKLKAMQAEVAKLEKQLKTQKDACIEQELKVFKMKHDLNAQTTE